MSNLFWLNDAQMARLEPFFPKSHGRPRVDDQPDEGRRGREPPTEADVCGPEHASRPS